MSGYIKLNREMTILRFHILLAALCVILGGFSSSTLAQHGHGVLSPSVTFPQEDAVLQEPPRMLTLSYRVDVRLLKLALYTDSGDWIDIGFSYDPKLMNHSFVYPLPELPTAAYYMVQWSVVDERQRFLSGQFNFSFGPGSIPPSETIAASFRSVEDENLPSTGSYVPVRN